MCIDTILPDEEKERVTKDGQEEEGIEDGEELEGMKDGEVQEGMVNGEEQEGVVPYMLTLQFIFNLFSFHNFILYHFYFIILF